MRMSELIKNKNTQKLMLAFSGPRIREGKHFSNVFEFMPH